MEKLLKFDDEMRLKYAATLSRNGNSNSRFEKTVKESHIAVLLDLRNEIHEFRENLESTLHLFSVLDAIQPPDTSEIDEKITVIEANLDALDSIISNFEAAPRITVQPVSQTCKIGAFASFQVEAVGIGLQYLWIYTPLTGVWKPTTADGFNTPCVTLEGKSYRDGYTYQCKITDIFGRVTYSDVVTLDVMQTLRITKQPEDVTAQLESKVVFNVEAEGEGLTYQWEWRSKSTNPWSASSSHGNKTNAITIDALANRNGYYYRCVVTDAYGNVVESNAALLTVT